MLEQVRHRPSAGCVCDVLAGATTCLLGTPNVARRRVGGTLGNILQVDTVRWDKPKHTFTVCNLVYDHVHIGG